MATKTTKKTTATTAKKTTKSPAKKATTAPVKKTTATTAKKRPVAKKSTKQPKAPKYESFKLASNDEPFMQVRFNIQTVYWLILGFVVVMFSWYTISVSQSIEDIYSQIDQIRIEEDSIVVPQQTN